MTDTALDRALREARMLRDPLPRPARRRPTGGDPGGGRPPGRRRGEWQLPELLTAADAQAPLHERNLWLVRAWQWLNRPAGRPDPHTPWPVLRLRHLLSVLEREPKARAQVAGLLGRLWLEGDAASLFADMGLSARRGLWSALVERCRARWVPGSTDTRDLALLFALMLPRGTDAGWLEALDHATLADLGRLVGEAGLSPRDLHPPLARAMRWLASSVCTTAWSPAMRRRLDIGADALGPFDRLEPAVDRLCLALDEPEKLAPAQAANVLRAVLHQCRQAASVLSSHLREHGVSVDLLVDEEQMQLRLDRIEALLDLRLAERPAPELARLVCRLAAEHRQQLGVRELLRSHHRLLARKLAERHAQTGEHYIARDASEYRRLLAQAAGGGAVIAFTTWGKFALGSLALLPFWTGLGSGLLYAASFVFIYLAHWTLATKQPAMTAAALAARLAGLRAGGGDPQAALAFVDEALALVRSQWAGVLGNLGLVIPVMLALQGLAWSLAGAPLIDEAQAREVLDKLSLLGPTAAFAAFTGVLLFVSSLVGGWVENAFAYHQGAAVLATNPRIVARLGAARAQRWAQWWRQHIHGLASNIALGLILGLVPTLLNILGIAVDVRHVTLATGQLTAAVGTLGMSVLETPAFWSCVAAIVVVGLLNLGVSFVLSMRSVMRARELTLGDRRALRAAFALRLRHDPLSLFRAPRP